MNLKFNPKPNQRNNMFLKNNRKIRNYWLYPKFQLTVAIASMLTGIVSVITCLYIVSSSFSHFETVAKKLNISKESSFYKLINFQEQLVFNRLITASIICIIITFIISFIITHRAVGPIYRLKKYLEDYDRNNPTNLSFRDGDFFEDLPEKINKVVNKKD